MFRAHRFAPAALASIVLLADVRAQTNPGTWETPFNHTILPTWAPGQPDWDGEQKSPYAPPNSPQQFMAGHMALIPVGSERGKLLVWNWMRVPYGNPIGKQHWAIVDPYAVPPTFQNFDLSIPVNDGDLFCSGHSWTKDGHLFVAGGNRYTGAVLGPNRLSYRFDPTQPTGNSMWRRERNMALERWYPTVTTLGNDLLVVSGGFDFVLPVPSALSPYTYEVFDPLLPTGQWRVDVSTGNAYFPGPPGLNCSEMFAIYPRAHLLSTGWLFFSGMATHSYRVDQSTAGVGPPNWEIQPSNPFPSISASYGSHFLFPNLGGPGSAYQDRVYRLGGAVESWDTVNCVPNGLAGPVAGMQSCPASVTPTTNPAWIWNPEPSMNSARYHANAVLLPDGSILVVGGNKDLTAEFDCALPVLQPEIFNDVPFTWTSAIPATIRRGYHSTAVLLPDGRVMVAGGEKREMDYEVFRPHYLNNGTVRPKILNAPSTLAMRYGQNYRLDYAPGVTVDHAVLMAPGSVTHHSDMHQRYFEMQTNTPAPGPTTISFQAPANSNLAPRGYYMLFLISTVQPGANRGTPSNAIWVNLQ